MPNDMKLPEGKTCVACFHVRKCVGMFGVTETNTACDFSPSRFRLRHVHGTTIKEIIADYLLLNGYDGLYCDECACGDDNLMPCDSDGLQHCQPGYKWDCKKCPNEKNGDYYCPNYDGADWCMNAEKQGGENV